MTAVVKMARDTWLTLQYEVGLMFRNPKNIAITLIQPLTYLALFTPFIKAVMGTSTYGDAYAIYVPSLFAAMGVFSGMFAGFALLSAVRQGVITRFRVTPLSRVGLLLGRAFLFVVLTGFQAVIVVAAAFVLGMRVSVVSFVIAVGLLSMMVLLSVTISYALAILVPDENSLSVLTNAAAQPISLLAGVLIPLSVAPLWVQRVALWNPFAWGTNGMRASFEGHFGNPVVWQAALILTVLAVGSAVLASRLFSREIA
jgi:ABC-2 type transport system permease protein